MLSTAVVPFVKGADVVSGGGTVLPLPLTIGTLEMLSAEVLSTIVVPFVIGAEVVSGGGTVLPLPVT